MRDLPGLDTLDVLSAVAARTRRIMIGTAVLQASLYHPLDLARRAVTLDHLSQGRFILGVGTGGWALEYDNLGIPFKQRAGRLDETIDILKKLWTAEGEIDYEGRYYKLRGVVCLPKPIQKPHPKIVGGGVWHGSVMGRTAIGAQTEWSERAISRIAKYCDGWITLSTIPVSRAAEIIKEGMERIKARAKESGRTITDEEFLLVAETGFINLNPSRHKALEAGESFYDARVARGFHQSRGNPSLETHIKTGAYGSPQEIADFVRQWLNVKKEVPALKRLQLNLAAFNLVEQLRRFHEEVFPLIEKDLGET
jgi:alkanesulfonate monooxygenase SsuD/methylene tetrahydromethanopterin reductase-like flavin-dependent oxidoreductase (luciferase family)